MYGMAFSFVKNNEDGKDVVQSVMCKFMTMDKELFPAKSEYYWLYKVIKNESIGVIRKYSRIVSLDFF